MPNLHKVNDLLYRSAQPSTEGMQHLKQMGIKTVINLRSLHSDADEIGSLDLRSRAIPMIAWGPDKDQLVQFLQIATDPAQGPVLVHCHHGADRTGVLCAVYRMVVQGWTKDEALKEMTEGGFGFHGVLKNLEVYIKNLDIQRIKQKL